ncbi:hypothetical protein ACWDZ4_19240 [Streptomyces sp. NPDC003016]
MLVCTLLLAVAVSVTSCQGPSGGGRVGASGGSPAGTVVPPGYGTVLLGAGGSADRRIGDGAVPRGYACTRNLEEPHPGGPGKGGGPRTVVGDCLCTVRQGQVKETPCDGPGEGAPQFEVAAAVQRRARCPPATRLYARPGGERAVGRARRV